MGTDVRLLTAYGDDVHGQKISASCSELGIDLSHARQITGGTTSTCLYLSDHTGKTVTAISDMEICKKITPTYLAGHLGLLQNAQAVICDANIPEESLIYLAENCTTPLFCDPVSAAKAEKVLPILSRIHTLKPSVREASVLTGIRIETHRDLENAADRLLEQGVQNLFITLGERGIFVATQEQRMLLPALPGTPVNESGAGDAVTAALAWAYLEGMELKETALAALAAWAITAESAETVNPAMSATAVKTRAKHN
jgi:pseudouridine kinase